MKSSLKTKHTLRSCYNSINPCEPMRRRAGCCRNPIAQLPASITAGCDTTCTSVRLGSHSAAPRSALPGAQPGTRATAGTSGATATAAGAAASPARAPASPVTPSPRNGKHLTPQGAVLPGGKGGAANVGTRRARSRPFISRDWLPSRRTDLGTSGGQESCRRRTAGDHGTGAEPTGIGHTHTDSNPSSPSSDVISSSSACWPGKGRLFSFTS